MTPVTPPAHPGDELFWLLRRALHTMRRDVREQVDLTPSRHRLLRVLARAGEPQRQTALATALDVVPRSVTSLVDDLERVALVERRPDPTDRRATLVALTDDGRAVLTEADRQRRRHAEELLGRLEPGERDDLLRLLHRLVDDPDPASAGGCPAS
ncbi:MarR family winged helix-turn-helix transcriptional regulator [Cellulomonas sp. Marseille-Q8402]